MGDGKFIILDLRRSERNEELSSEGWKRADNADPSRNAIMLWTNGVEGLGRIMRARECLDRAEYRLGKTSNHTPEDIGQQSYRHFDRSNASVETGSDAQI